MEKRTNNIFNSDIEIPDIVQQKADLAFSQIRKEKIEMTNKNIRETEPERNGSIRKVISWKKLIAAVAACAVLMTAMGVGNFYQKEKASNTEMAEKADNNVVNTTPFVLTVQAAGLKGNESRELESGIPVAIDANVDGWVLSGSEDGASTYCINIPFSCEGENIESITYSINKGAFQVVEKEGASIIIDGKEYSGSINAGQIGGVYDEENDGMPIYPVSLKYYTEITLDYESQSSETTWINMCNEVKLSDMDLIWGENITMEDYKKGCQELINGVVITCTVNFSNGTSQSTNLEVGTVLTTAKKAGFDHAVDPNAEEVFFTFERK